MLDKKALRREIGQKKRAMAAAEIAAYSRNLAEKLYETEEYRQARAIYAYLPYNQEVRTWEIVERAWKDGKRVAVPKVYGDEMRFLWIEDFTQIAPGGWNIPEPTFDEPVAEDDTALVLMPGLAFDPEGHRVGYGGGFYDKYLEAHPGHRLVALCYPFQLLDHLEVEEHDIPVNRVICADELRLVEPFAAYAEQISAYRRKFLECGDSMDGTGSLARTEDPSEWLRQTEELRNPDTVPEGWVPATQYLCIRVRDDRLVGMIQIRHSFNNYLASYGGHIGYSVRPGERRRGYATWMLSAILPRCRELGLEKVLVTCDQTNAASRGTILANGGKYESSVFEPEEGATLERYWIEL